MSTKQTWTELAKTLTKDQLERVLESLEDELSTNELNLLRMTYGLTRPSDQPLNFGDEDPVVVQQETARLQLGILKHPEGQRLLRKNKIISRLRDKGR